MSVAEAVAQLLEVEAAEGGGAYGPGTLAVGVARLGSPDQRVRRARGHVWGCAEGLSGEEWGPICVGHDVCQVLGRVCCWYLAASPCCAKQHRRFGCDACACSGSLLLKWLRR